MPVERLTPCDSPVLSVVVAIASDTTSPPDARHFGQCLDALARQAGAPAMEVIVPHPPTVAGIEVLRQRHPGVRFLEITDLRKYNGLGNSREHHGELISRGLAEARGSVVAVIEDNDIAAPDWSSRIMEAHRGPFAGVGGAIENGIDRPLNWAVYFCDFLRYQNPLPEGESTRASDANVTYKRAALEAIRSAWKEEFHEAVVNGALLAHGEKLALAPDAVVYQHRQGLRLSSALVERFVWGRSFGAWRSGQAGTLRRVYWAAFSPLLPILLTARMTLMAAQKRRTLGAFLKALPLTAAMTVAWSLGEMGGYITGQANAVGARAARAMTRGSQAAI